MTAHNARIQELTDRIQEMQKQLLEEFPEAEISITARMPLGEDQGHTFVNHSNVSAEGLGEIVVATAASVIDQIFDEENPGDALLLLLDSMRIAAQQFRPDLKNLLKAVFGMWLHSLGAVYIPISFPDDPTKENVIRYGKIMSGEFSDILLADTSGYTDEMAAIRSEMFLKVANVLLYGLSFDFPDYVIALGGDLLISSDQRPAFDLRTSMLCAGDAFNTGKLLTGFIAVASEEFISADTPEIYSRFLEGLLKEAWAFSNQSSANRKKMKRAAVAINRGAEESRVSSNPVSPKEMRRMRRRANRNKGDKH